MLCADWNLGLVITEMVWDAKQLHLRDIPLKPQIWSSSPLYDSDMKKQRENWFDDFRRNNEITAEKVWDFHHKAGIGDQHIDLIIDRGFLKTQSISQIEISENIKQFRYEELATGNIEILSLDHLV